MYCIVYFDMRRVIRFKAVHLNETVFEPEIELHAVPWSHFFDLDVKHITL